MFFSTDSLIIGYFLGLSVLGIYSNYLLIFGAFNSISWKIISYFSPIFGNTYFRKDYNLNVSLTLRLKKILNFLFVVVFSFSTLLIFNLNIFLNVWLGNSTLLLSIDITLLFTLMIHLLFLNQVLYMMFEVFGLLTKKSLLMVLFGLINIIFSIISVQYLGLIGVILGSIIALLLQIFYYSFQILFFDRKIFSLIINTFFINFITYLILLCLLVILGYYLDLNQLQKFFLNTFLISFVSLTLLIYNNDYEKKRIH
jgi:O-antigen/teichoic acid export membrane protein